MPVGFKDILRESNDLYKNMIAKGSICWPPVCNPSDSKVPPNNFGANPTQFLNGNKNHFDGK